MATRREAVKKSSRMARRPPANARLRGKTGAPKKPSVSRKTRDAAARDEPRFVGRYIRGRAKVSAKGWIVIPKEIRNEMGLRPGDEVDLSLWPPPLNMKQDRGLYDLHVSRVSEDPVALGLGLFVRRPGQPSLTEKLLEERRREREQEERDLPPPLSLRDVA